LLGFRRVPFRFRVFFFFFLFNILFIVQLQGQAGVFLDECIYCRT